MKLFKKDIKELGFENLSYYDRKNLNMIDGLKKVKDKDVEIKVEENFIRINISSLTLTILIKDGKIKVNNIDEEKEVYIILLNELVKILKVIPLNFYYKVQYNSTKNYYMIFTNEHGLYKGKIKKFTNLMARKLPLFECAEQSEK